MKDNIQVVNSDGLTVGQVMKALKNTAGHFPQKDFDSSTSEVIALRAIIQEVSKLLEQEHNNENRPQRTVFICKKNELGEAKVVAATDDIEKKISVKFYNQSDNTSVECSIEKITYPPAKAFIKAPIKVGSGTMGLFIIASDTPNDLNLERDSTLRDCLELFADQAAKELLKHRFQSMTTKLFSQVNEQVEKKQLLNTILEVAAYLLQSSRGGLYEYNPHDETVTLIAPFNQESKEGHKMPVGRGVAGYLVKNKIDQEIIPDYRKWDNKVDNFGDDPQYASVLGVLLKRQDGSIIGSFSLDCPVDRGWNQVDAAVLRSFGDYVQLAYEQLDRLKMLKRINDAAYHIGNLPVIEKPLEEVLDDIVITVGSALKQYFFSLLIIKEPEVPMATSIIWVHATGFNSSDKKIIPSGKIFEFKQFNSILRQPNRPKETLFNTNTDIFHSDDKYIVKLLKETGVDKNITLVPLRASQSETFIGVAIIGSHSGDQVIDKHGISLLANQIKVQITHHNDFKENIDSLGEVAHSLRFPLSQVLGFAQLLKKQEKSLSHGKKYATSSEVAYYIDEIIHHMKIQENRIERILDLAQLTHNDTTLKENTVLVKDVILDAYNENKESVTNHNISFKTQLNKKSYSVLVDNRRIQNVLSALIENAVNAISEKKENEEDGAIIICESSDDDFGIIKIIDNGTGIPKKDISNIFHRSKRGSNSGSFGTGMGLAYALRLLKRLGGDLNCNSIVGKGAEFIIFLPKIRD